MKVRVLIVKIMITRRVHAFLDGYEYSFLTSRFPKKKYSVSIIKKKGYKFEKEKTEKEVLERIEKLKHSKSTTFYMYYEQEI